MNKRLLYVLVIFALLASALSGPLSIVAAQSGDCGGYDCVDQDDFTSSRVDPPTSNLDEWQIIGVNATLDWLAEKSFGFWAWETKAYGVIRASGSFTLQKSFYLDPGWYRVMWRGAAEKEYGLFEPQIIFQGQAGNSPYALRAVAVGDAWEENTSEAFQVDNPGPVTLKVITLEPPDTIYFDYIWLVREPSSAPTPTPNLTFGPPTPTPLSGTPTPVPTQSTPIPVPTAYCVPAATATPGPGQFATRTPTPAAGTATPTAVPGWSYLEMFSFSLNNWSALGSEIEFANNVNHSPSTLTHTARSVRVGYSNIAGTTAVTLTNALVYAPQVAFAAPFYVDGWAQADNLPSGEQAYIDVWAYDDGAGQWTKAGYQQISPRYWYNFHITVTTPSLVSAIAFTLRRTDNPASGSGYLDDVYIYGDLSAAPRCDGSYPVTTRLISGVTNTIGGAADEDVYTITYPTDKPCPPPTLETPNNFWGPLLNGITIWLVNTFAMSPAYAAGTIVTWANALFQSPMALYWSLYATMIDLRPAAFMGGIIIVAEGVRLALSIWRLIKRQFPVGGA